MNHWRVFRVALLVGARDFRLFWNWRTWAFGWMARILTSAASWVLVGKLVGDAGRLDYLLIGNASVAGVGTFAVAASAWERWDGTYPLLVAAPSSMAPAMMGRMAIWVLHWVASSLCTFALLLAVFGLRLSFPALLVVPLGVILLSLSTYALSLFLGAWIGLIPALRNIVINILTTAILVLSGATVKVAFWPKWVQAIARILPATHALAGIRSALAGGSAWTVARAFGLEIVVCLGWLALALLTIDRIADAGRASGSIHLS
ncbi:MAG: ABC transporter permease [Pseudomonadota bacterium]